MKGFLLSSVFVLGTTIAANACFGPPICSQVPGLLAPNGNVQEYGGTAGARTLASGGNPQWDWDLSDRSYAYIYGGPITGPGFNPNDLTGHVWTMTYSWSIFNPSTPESGHSTIVDIHCFIAGNDGTVWFYAPSVLGYYDQIGGEPPNSSVSISCPIDGLDGNGLGPIHWWNNHGQSAHSNVSVANSYANTMRNSSTAIFAMGLAFGDSACRPDWDSAAFPGNNTCWADGAFALGSHFTVFGNSVQ